MELGSIERERAALVVGGPGAGKGALVGELLRRRPAGVLCGRCAAGAPPLAPFVQMGMPAPADGDGPPEARRAAQPLPDAALHATVREAGLAYERLILESKQQR